MNRSSKISSFFILLYLVFLGNANIYATNLSIESTSSCCLSESEGCCGDCNNEESKDTNNCCQGNGCCGVVETRLPITIFSPKSEIEQKVSIKPLRIKPSLNGSASLSFICILPKKPNFIRVHFFTHSARSNDRLAKVSIWRC